MALIHKEPSATYVELTPAEAGLQIAHLAAALGGTSLPNQQAGGAFSAESADGQRVIIGLRSESEPAWLKKLDWERSLGITKNVVHSRAVLARPREGDHFGGISPLIYLDIVGWTLRCDPLGLNDIRLVAKDVADAEHEAMDLVRSALRKLLHTAEQFK